MNVILIIAAVLAIVYLVACSQKQAPAPPANIPAPVELRKDLIYSYFGSNVQQIDETKDHVNAHMVMNWGGDDNQLVGMKEAVRQGLKLIVEFPQALVSEQSVRLRLNEFKEHGLLEHILIWYLVDEPEKHGYTHVDIAEANHRIKTVGAEYGLLVKTAVIYSADFNFIGIEYYDYVGFDNYDAGDRIFTNGQYMKLKQMLKPTQQIILVPGGCDKWRTDPEQFFNVAQRDPQVGILMPFIWLDGADPANGAFSGIRSNGMRMKYWDVGMKISH